MLVHRVTRVRGDVYTEVACLRVHVLHVRRDARVLRIRRYGVAVAQAEGHVLRTSNDVHRSGEFLRGAHDRRLREEHSLRRWLLRLSRQIERVR